MPQCGINRVHATIFYKQAVTIRFLFFDLSLAAITLIIQCKRWSVLLCKIESGYVSEYVLLIYRHGCGLPSLLSSISFLLAIAHYNLNMINETAIVT